jgi:sugar lactone lactonase YvrE
VGDTGRGRLLRYTVEDRNVKPAGEMSAPQLSAPIRVEINSKDEVFALDGKQRRIVRFDGKGAFAGYLEPEGVPAPASIVPRSFKIGRDDAIYVLDVFSARVLVLAPDGKYLRHVPFPKEYGFFSDLAVDSRGKIYLLDSLRATVHAAAKDAREFSLMAKSLRAHLSFPTSIAVDGRGTLYLVDEHGGGIVLVGQDGAVLGRQLAMGWNEGLVNSPSQVCLNDKGQVFIADRGNSRVQVFSIVR